MSSLLDTKSLSNRLRPTRAAVVFGSSTPQNATRYAVEDLFKPLGVKVFYSLDLEQDWLSEQYSQREYDIIALIGKAKDFSNITRKGKHSIEDNNLMVLSFAPRSQFNERKRFLEFSDALVLCDQDGRNWEPKVSGIVFHFVESLLVPSMLNIDLADVRRIAKGVGLAFNTADDDSRKIIAKLPEQCLVARSAVLHFSCTDDVRLKEIYSVSKSIALKKGLAGVDPVISSHSDAKKIIRKVNVKMGIRIINERDLTDEDASLYESPGQMEMQDKRISMTAILFGL